MTRKPAISLAAVPGRRRPILEAAVRAEQQGFPGIFCPSLGDNLSLCLAIAQVTQQVLVGTSITPIYT
ncbi:MAG: hypothetical protein ACR2PZ_16590, partial [Pseudomonadales bacterium]